MVENELPLAKKKNANKEYAKYILIYFQSKAPPPPPLCPRASLGPRAPTRRPASPLERLARRLAALLWPLASRQRVTVSEHTNGKYSR